MPEDRLLRCGQVLPFQGPGVSAWQSQGTLHDTQAEGSFPVGLCGSSVGGFRPVSWHSQLPSGCPGRRLPKSWGAPAGAFCSPALVSRPQQILPCPRWFIPTVPPARLGRRPRWDAGTLTGGRCFSRSVPSRTLCHSPRGGGCSQTSHFYLLCGQRALQGVTCSCSVVVILGFFSSSDYLCFYLLTDTFLFFPT